jgi:hypothetical protein
MADTDTIQVATADDDTLPPFLRRQRDQQNAPLVPQNSGLVTPPALAPRVSTPPDPPWTANAPALRPGEIYRAGGTPLGRIVDQPGQGGVGSPDWQAIQRLPPIASAISWPEARFQNIRQRDAQGNPTGPASGYFQIEDATWRYYAPLAGVNVNQFPTAMSTDLATQWRVAIVIPANRWAKDTYAGMQRMYPWMNGNQTIGQIAQAASQLPPQQYIPSEGREPGQWGKPPVMEDGPGNLPQNYDMPRVMQAQFASLPFQSGYSAQPGYQMMGAYGGMTAATSAGQIQLAKMMQTRWQDALDESLARQQEESIDYNDAFVTCGDDEECIGRAVGEISAKYDDPMIRDAFANGGSSRVMQIMKQRDARYQDLAKAGKASKTAEQQKLDTEKEQAEIDELKARADVERTNKTLVGGPGGLGGLTSSPTAGQSPAPEAPAPSTGGGTGAAPDPSLTAPAQPSGGGAGASPAGQPAPSEQGQAAPPARPGSKGVQVAEAASDLPDPAAAVLAQADQPADEPQPPPPYNLVVGNQPFSVPRGSPADQMSTQLQETGELKDVPGATPAIKAAGENLIRTLAGLKEARLHTAVHDLPPSLPQGELTSRLQEMEKAGTLPSGMAEIVSGLIDGTVPVSPFMLRSPFWRDAFSLAKRVDPTLDLANYPTRVAAIKDWLSGTDGRALTRLSTAFDQANLLLKRVNELEAEKDSGLRIAATHIPVIGPAFTKPALGTYMANLNTFATEFSAAMAGSGTGGVTDRERVMNELSPMTPAATLRQMIQSHITSLGARQDELKKRALAAGAAGNMAGVQRLFDRTGGAPDAEQQAVLERAAKGENVPVVWDQQGKAHYYKGTGDPNDHKNWTK